MTYIAIKTILSALIIVAISEIGKRSPGFAALVASLPLISVLGMLWLWRDTADPVRLSEHAYATFWFVLPSLPMFLLIPFLIGRGIHFYGALGAGVLLTIGLYFLTMCLLPKMGIDLVN
jgi:hypothetical protein